MIVATDESGSFGEESTDRHFFVSVHIRQRKTLYKAKERQFFEWEETLPREAKNSKGEIKSSALDDEHLVRFAHSVICSAPFVRITPLTISTAKHPAEVVRKRQSAVVGSIRAGTQEFRARLSSGQLQFSEELGYWMEKLSYSQFLKLSLLGERLYVSLQNSIGHSVVQNFAESELPRLRFLIDQDFIKGDRRLAFWQHVLRSQMYHASMRSGLPAMKGSRKYGDEFLKSLKIGDAFKERCTFAASHENFEIRIADAVNTILSRSSRGRESSVGFNLIKKCFCRHGKIIEIEYPDFDLSALKFDPMANPWANADLGSDVLFS